jgi:hypothetical protein
MVPFEPAPFTPPHDPPMMAWRRHGRCTWHRKWARNAASAVIARETLEAMDPQYPKPAWNPKDFEVE